MFNVFVWGDSVYFWKDKVNEEIMFTFGEIAFTFGFTFGEIRFTLGDSRRFYVWGIYIFLLLGVWGIYGSGALQGFRKEATQEALK